MGRATQYSIDALVSIFKVVSPRRPPGFRGWDGYGPAKGEPLKIANFPEKEHRTDRLKRC